MPRFTKKILPPGTYRVGSRNIKVTPERMRRWVRQFNKMKKLGLRIPAPWKHDEKAVPLREADDKDVDAFNNGGWWEKLMVKRSDGSLYGVVDIPDAEKAKKIGTEVTDVSPSIKGHYVAGTGDEFKDAITHIALCTHPIVPGQDNFEPSDDIAAAQNFCLSVDMRVDDSDFASMPDNNSQKPPQPIGKSDNGQDEEGEQRTENGENENVSAASANVDDAIAVLQQLGITLPADTDESNFIERIVTAGVALAGKQQQMEEEEPPEAAKGQPDAIALSQESEMTTWKFDPLTGKELNEQEAGQRREDEINLSQAAGRYASRMAVKTYESRIESLIKQGKTTKEYVEKHLQPLLENYNLSFDTNGDPTSTTLDTLLDALEAIPSSGLLGTPQTVDMSQVATEESVGDAWDGGEMTESDVNRILAEQSKSSGRKLG